MQPELPRTGAQQCQPGCRERWNNQPLKYKPSLREKCQPAPPKGLAAWLGLPRAPAHTIYELGATLGGSGVL